MPIVRQRPFSAVSLTVGCAKQMAKHHQSNQLDRVLLSRLSVSNLRLANPDTSFALLMCYTLFTYLIRKYVNTETVLQDMIDKLIEIERCYGKEMNLDKTKVMRISRQPFPVKIMIDQK